MKSNPTFKIMKKLMMKGIPLILPLMFFTALPENIRAQQVTPTVVCSGGETFTAGGLSLDFTIGEIMTESLPASGKLLTQGFLQGPDKNTGIEENLIDEKDVVVYPNPAGNLIYILNNNRETNPVSANIEDLQGRNVLHMDCTTNPVRLNLENLTPGFYMVSVLLDNHQTINKKIIKQ